MFLLGATCWTLQSEVTPGAANIYITFMFILLALGLNPDSIGVLVRPTATQTGAWIPPMSNRFRVRFKLPGTRSGIEMTSWGQIPEHLPSCDHGCGIVPHGASWPVLIFFVCSLTPLLCLFCSLQEEVLSPGFTPCASTLDVTGETVSLWSRLWISRDGLGYRSLNLGFRVPTQNTCRECGCVEKRTHLVVNSSGYKFNVLLLFHFHFMPIFTSTTQLRGKYCTFYSTTFIR